MLRRIYTLHAVAYPTIPGYVRVTCAERMIVPVVRVGLARALNAAMMAIVCELDDDRAAGELTGDEPILEFAYVDHTGVGNDDAVPDTAYVPGVGLTSDPGVRAGLFMRGFLQ